MKRAPDRKRLRRDYVTGRLRGALIETAGYCLFHLALVFALIATDMLVVSLVGAYERMAHWFLFAFLATVVTAGLSALTFWCSSRLHGAGVTLLHAPYVPPVTLENLPVAEVLVRSSEQPPTAQSDVLLRAANGQETLKEELLRVTAEK
jgi:hypothetical protein